MIGSDFVYIYDNKNINIDLKALLAGFLGISIPHIFF